MHRRVIALIAVGLSAAMSVLAFIYSIPLMEAGTTVFKKFF